jgi:hypothetical protein
MKFLHSGLVLMAGVLSAVSATGYTDVDVTKMNIKPDIREAILQRFLSANHSPVESYAGNFIREADAHHLDWRLLPSLAWIESGAGQHNRKNNLFGWANGASRFSTASEAIHHVAEALAEARAYKGKDLFGKLAAYNPTPGYRGLVTAVMAKISRLPEPTSFEEAFISRSWRSGSCQAAVIGSL